MNKTDRLLAIMLELQRNERLRAEDLAATFETSVRTIYRDMQALSEAGVPVIGAPGQGYSLMEGYFLPPVSFTVEEAVTLLIGSDFIQEWFDNDYASHARTSRGKIEAILSGVTRSEASRIRKNYRLRVPAKDALHIQERAYMETISQAILRERKIKFGYRKRIAETDGNRESMRTVAPYGLVLFHDCWVLIAHCDLRQDIRHFRLSRMTDLMEMEEVFTLPSDFQLDRYQPPDDRNTVVRIQVQSDIADKIRESNNFYMETIEDHPEGLLVTFRVRQPEELLQWVLGWGSGVTVLEPESFRHRITQEINNMQQRY